MSKGLRNTWEIPSGNQRLRQNPLHTAYSPLSSRGVSSPRPLLTLPCTYPISSRPRYPLSLHLRGPNSNQNDLWSQERRGRCPLSSCQPGPLYRLAAGAARPSRRRQRRTYEPHGDEKKKQLKQFLPKRTIRSKRAIFT